MIVKLRLTGAQHADLQRHLFPGDGNEAVALALCGRRRGGDHHVLTVRRLLTIPHERCSSRTPWQVTWPADVLPPLLQEAAARHMAIVKFHSHHGGLASFSGTDDQADVDLFSSVDAWVDDGLPHASTVMLPDGTMFGRAVLPGGALRPLDLIAVAGDDLRFWRSGTESREVAGEALVRHRQLFGDGTLGRLRRLTVAVIGCSGTGSVVVEQLARLGVGGLILVDPDRVERKNLNRILNATLEDALQGRFKVHVLRRAVEAMALGTDVSSIPENLAAPDVIRAVAAADIAFGCMDGPEGRHLLNRLCAFYLLPYFDVGVRLEADGQGGIDQVAGTVHYLQPDGSSVLSRGVLTMEEVQTWALDRTDPEEYGERLKAGYIKGVRVDRPAVISVNMQLASMAVNEFLARLHPYRYDPNGDFAVHRVSLIQGATYMEADGKPCTVLPRHAGRGDVCPLLDMPALSERLLG